MGMLWSQLSGGWEGTVTLNCNPSSRMTCSQASGGRPDGRVPNVCTLALPPPMGGLPSSGPHSPAGREGRGGGHTATATATTTTVTEGTFPSHLELSKSRSRACKPGCRTLSGPPSPRMGATQTHGGSVQSRCGPGREPETSQDQSCHGLLCQ